MFGSRVRSWVSAGLVVGGLCGVAAATPLIVSASVPPRAASATFDVDGSDLVVTLTNNSTFDVLEPSQVLTALFFNSSVPLTLTPSSAVVPAGSSVLFGGTDPGGVVGGEWAYRSGLVGAPHGSAYGISSAGFNLFGPGDRFPGNNLEGPDEPDGIQYGVTSTGDDPATGNATVTGDNALIKDTVVFRLSGVPAGFDPFTSISGVNWQYGTALTEPNIPEPASLALLALGAFALLRRR